MDGVGFSVGREMPNASATFDSARAVRDAIAQGVGNGGRGK